MLPSDSIAYIVQCQCSIDVRVYMRPLIDQKNIVFE
jgi:hypothetical protein